MKMFLTVGWTKRAISSRAALDIYCFSINIPWISQIAKSNVKWGKLTRHFHMFYACFCVFAAWKLKTKLATLLCLSGYIMVTSTYSDITCIRLYWANKFKSGKSSCIFSCSRKTKYRNISFFFFPASCSCDFKMSPQALWS